MDNRSGALGTARDLGKRAQGSFPVRLVRKFGADRGTNQAILIAWNFLQSMIPIILILLAVGGFLLSRAGMNATSIHDFIFGVVPAGNETRTSLERAIRGVQMRSGVFAILALLSFLWSSSSLFGCLEQILADNYGLKTRPFIRQKLMAFGMMLLLCVLAVIAVGSTTVTAFLRTLQIPYAPRWIVEGATGPILTAVVGIIAGIILFFAIFQLVPPRHPAPLHVLPGAVFSGVMFYVLTLVFPLYLELNQGINRYGSAFALLFTLLFFFYFLGLITVIGIEVNTVLFPIPPRVEPPDPAVEREVSRRVPPRVFGMLGAALAFALAVLHLRRTRAPRATPRRTS